MGGGSGSGRVGRGRFCGCSELGGFGLLLEGFAPSIAEVTDALQDFLNNFFVFADVGFLKTVVEIDIEARKAVGKFPAVFQVQRVIELANDGLGFGDVFVDGQVEIQRILVLEGSNGSPQKPNGPVVHHHDEILGRGRAHRVGAVGTQLIGTVHQSTHSIFHAASGGSKLTSGGGADRCQRFFCSISEAMSLAIPSMASAGG